MKSIWQEVNFKKFSSLNNDIKTDVLIVGGGIAGVLTAYLLEKAGIDYVLVEQGRICEKTTSKTTAKITIQNGLCYDKILKIFGNEFTSMYFNTNKYAFEQLLALLNGIDCDFEVKDNYVYSTKNRKDIENEITALEKIGYKADFLETLSLPVNIKGAIRFKDQAQFHPLKFLSHISKNLNIYENTKVEEFAPNIAYTSKGKIMAKNIIIATHFPIINKHGLFSLKLYQHRSYVVSLKNAPDFNGMYVDEDLKGMSFRNYKNYLLLGGGGHRTGNSGGNYKELYDFSKTHFSQCEIEHRWATQDCISLDKIPYIGEYTKSTSGLYVATGFNKWGIVSSMLAALLLVDKILGNNNDYFYTVSPLRKSYAPSVMLNALNSSINLLTPSTKRCPHLGCALKWNKAEHSWDCACHGSRFSETGKLLDNPACDDLK